MASEDKDLYLKMFVSSILRHLGYTVFQEVDLSTYSYQPTYQRKQITDFDVLGVLLEYDFSTHIAVTECKSMEDSAMENLLKLNGVKNFFGADKAYFAQKRVDVNAREVGKDLGIAVFDEKNIETLIQCLEIPKEYVDSEKRTYDLRVKSLAKIKNTHTLSKIKDYLRFDYWTLPDNRNIINLIRILGQNKEIFEKNPLENKYIAYQSITNFSLSLSKMINKVVRHNINNIKDGVLTNILGGPRDRRDKEVLFDTIAKIVTDTRLAAYPHYIDKLSELVQRYINSPKHSSLILAYLDLQTRILLNPDLASIFSSELAAFSSKTVKIARDTILFVTEASGIPATIFDDILTE